jgi:hypothetical protein
VFGLVLMFLLSSACNHLLLTREKDSFSFLMNDSSLPVQLSRYDFYDLSFPGKRVARYFLPLSYSAGSSAFRFSFLFSSSSLQFHVVFMIYSFLFLTLGHNPSSLARADSVLTSIKVARTCVRVRARVCWKWLVGVKFYSKPKPAYAHATTRTLIHSLTLTQRARRVGHPSALGHQHALTTLWSLPL